MKFSLERIAGVAMLVSTFAAAAAFAARAPQMQTQATTAACATAQVKLSKSAPKPGDELTATVSVANCSAEKERVIIKYSYTDPCGNTTDMGNAPLKIEAGETQEAQITFLAPAAECAGSFKINASVVSGGKELTSGSATFAANK